ncbi:hypothetical protein [Klebsiella pneumoniae]|uniref:hypothetical protein n=1 Tax=Klebsiella pneumoniae TaxID=573 RepID=UPI0015F3410A|nr:hypothetical protein [Klebsiella pneumoniae]
MNVYKATYDLRLAYKAVKGLQVEPVSVDAPLTLNSYVVPERLSEHKTNISRQA